MTISRPARRRWPALVAVAVAGGLVGLAIGLAIGGGDDEPDPVQGLRDAQSTLERASGVLGVVGLEYGQGVQDGRVASAPEYRGARDAIARSRELYYDARPALAFVDNAEATRIDHAYVALADAVSDRAPENRVKGEADALAARVRTALGNAR